jgi:protein-L-isoaspartate(D-aspartate) O-methyltransferase
MSLFGEKKHGYKYLRERMVELQLKGRDITDEQVLQAFLQIERHRFVEESLWDRAYDDCPLPIGKNQTISQPYIVALMTQALELKGIEKILEIGTGSGYQTVILARLASQVFTIERHFELAKSARAIFDTMGIQNIVLRIGDGTIGWQEFAPYNGIIVTAAAPKLPQSLAEQVALGGKLVIPIGEDFGQTLYVFTKRETSFDKKFLCPCSFVPLIGIEGWSNNFR